MAAGAPVIECASPFVELSSQTLGEFCRRWEVDRLRLVGSAKNGPFRPDSDLDFVFYGSFRARIFDPNGRPCRAATDELRTLVGRSVDLVSARLALANPFIAHDFFVRQEFTRHQGLLWNVQHAVASLAAAGPPEPALLDLVKRRTFEAALVSLGRACERESSIAEWRRIGLGALPWEEARAALGPIVRALHAVTDLPPWPCDRDLATLVNAIVSHSALVAEVTARELPASPALPEDTIREAGGDVPEVPAEGAAWPSADAPVLMLDSELHPQSRAAELTGLCRRFGIFRLVESRNARASVPQYAAFAETDARLYAAPGFIANDAVQAFGDLGATLLCARRIAVLDNPFAAYNAFIRRAFSPRDEGAWFVHAARNRLRDFAEATPATRLRGCGAALLRLGRAARCLSIEDLDSLGLRALPWEELRAAFDPWLSREPDARLPSAETVGELAQACLREHSAMRRVGAMALTHRPWVPQELMTLALGNMRPEAAHDWR
ncbi:MAG: nucleotidyltransferase domain-containing protein [Myxococcales bacterium]|nr:nucleotidyltransferase domain-containing protein [Myxococcales bacterium]